jgi:hypothetical protein
MLAMLGMELFKGELHHRCAASGFVETAGHAVYDEFDNPLEPRALARRVLERSSHRMLKGGAPVAVPQSVFDSGIFCNPHVEPSTCPDTYPICAYFDDNSAS